MSTTERNIHLGVLGASLALAVWVFGAQPRVAGPATHSDARPSRTELRSPLSIIPSGPAFVLSADLRSLARAPLGAVFASALGRAAGVEKLSALCGFDLFARLDDLALAAPTNLAVRQQLEDFGVVASGRFSAAEITRCATLAITQRGGEAIRSQLGSFESIRESRAGSGEIAAKAGLVVVSGGRYFRELLDSAENRSGTADTREIRDARHAELRRELGPGALLATWLFAEGWLERITGDEFDAKPSPLNALKSMAARVAVGETARVLLLLDCTDSNGATRIASFLDELRSTVQALPVGPQLAAVAARIALSRSGSRLTLSVELRRDELESVLAAFP